LLSYQRDWRQPSGLPETKRPDTAPYTFELPAVWCQKFAPRQTTRDGRLTDVGWRYSVLNKTPDRHKEKPKIK
jgi:hypothetical protein